MNLNEALELCQRVAEYAPAVRVVAIGRFKPIEELTDGDPWGVSIVADGGRPRVLWRADEFEPPKPASVATPKPGRKTDADIGLSQPALF
jgi:hypothetical protein